MHDWRMKAAQYIHGKCVNRVLRNKNLYKTKTGRMTFGHL